VAMPIGVDSPRDDAVMAVLAHLGAGGGFIGSIRYKV